MRTRRSTASRRCWCSSSGSSTPHRLGHGDDVYGGNPTQRTALEERGIGYVLAVACSAEVPTGAGTFRADAPVKTVPQRPGRSSRPGLARRGSGSTTGSSSTSSSRHQAASSS